MKKIKNWKLITKLTLPYTILLLIMLINAISLYVFMYNFDNYARLVDVAGTNRMYSQRIAYTAELITRASKPLHDELDVQIKLVNKTLQVFEEGGYIQGYKEPFEPLPDELKYILLSAVEYWKPYYENLQVLNTAQIVTYEESIVAVTSQDSIGHSISSSAIVSQLSPDVVDAMEYIESHSNELLQEFNKLVKEIVSIKNKNRSQSFIFIIILLITNILVIIVGILFNKKSVIQPIRSITTGTKEIAHGNLLAEITLPVTDTLGKLSINLAHLKRELLKKSEFINKLSSGNYEVDYILEHENDTLGTSLLNMKQKLILKAKEEVTRKEEEAKQNWLTKKLADFGEILRRDNSNIEQFSFNLIQYLVVSLDANQGGVFLLNEENKEDIYVELISSLAFDKRKFNQKRIELGEGLVGRVILEKKYIYMKLVPEDYINITSGLGQANPRNIVLVPLILNNEVYGVIEVASFTEFKKHQLEFINKAAESIASTLSSVKTGIRTKKLLEESQSQQEALALKEEEMLNNMAELQAVQEEASVQGEILSSFTNSVNQTLIRAEYSVEGNLLFANAKFLKLLAYNSIVEIEGREIYSFISEDETAKFKETWASLATGGEHFEGKMKYISKLRKDIWMIATYSVVTNQEGNVDKILFLAIDITEDEVKNRSNKSQLDENLVRLEEKEIELTNLKNTINE